MANLTNITDLPIADSADNLNLIVEDNGVAKKITASEVGAQADWNEEDDTSPAYIKNKPTISSGGGGGAYMYNATGFPTVYNVEVYSDEDMSDMQAYSDLFRERVASGYVVLNWDGNLLPVLGYMADGSIYLVHPSGGAEWYNSNLLPYSG